MKRLKKQSPQRESRRVHGFDVLENQCIWMKAGVVNYRICDNAFDCSTCAFDRAMQRAMKMDPTTEIPTEKPEWVETLLRRYDGANRPCRHALTGRIDAPKICPYNYECYHCAFDQMLDDMELTDDPSRPVCDRVSGFQMAAGYYYHMGHCWARIEHGGRIRVGYDDFLTRLFGRMSSCDLPSLGVNLLQDQVGWTFKRDDHQAAVLSPVTGTVLAVNHLVEDHPEIAHEDPYHHGWLFILEPVAPKRSLKRLYFGAESFRWIDNESQKLLRMIGPEYESLAATGGTVVKDIFGSFERIEWDSLVHTFLHTTER